MNEARIDAGMLACVKDDQVEIAITRLRNVERDKLTHTLNLLFRFNHRR